MASIPTELVPQADKLERVFDVVEAILNGKTTDKEIAEVCKLPSKRQGGYYRLAAMSLGLIEEAEGRWQATILGETIANIDDHYQKVSLMRAIILLNPFVRLLYHEAEAAGKHGLSKMDLVRIARANSDLSQTTAERRVDTVMRWFSYLGLVRRTASKIVLRTARA